MELSYHVEKVIKEDIPKLQHGNDGLIYTCAESGYVVGTDQRMYVLRRFPFPLSHHLTYFCTTFNREHLLVA